jgi:hypothetical protein
MALSQGRAILVAAVVAAVLEYFVASLLRTAWLFPIIEGHTFYSSLEWFDPLALVYWGFAFCFAFLVGGALGLVFPASWARVGVTCGVVGGLVHFVNSRNILHSPDAIHLLWVYGVYVVPVLGATAGAAVFHLVSHRGRQVPSNNSLEADRAA